MPINEAEIVWDEPTQQPSQQMQQPIQMQLNEQDVVWDDQQPQPTQMQTQEQPQQEPSMWDRIMSYKDKIGKTLAEKTPIMSIPKMVVGATGEAMQKEGSELERASSVKSRLENIEFEYSDIADQLKSAVNDPEAMKNIKAKKDNINTEVTKLLNDRGIESYYDNGKLLVVTKDENGKEVLKDLNEETFDNIVGGFTSGAGEIGGAVMGAAGGATQAQRFLPPTASPQQRAVAGTIGAGVGGYTGATLGRATDLIRNAISLNKEIDTRDVIEKSLEAGTADILGTAIIGAVGKGASKLAEPVKKLTDRAKTLLKQGNIQGATKQIKKDYEISDIDIDNAFKSIKKDVDGLDDLTGDDLQRAKLLAVVQQQDTGFETIKQALQQNPKAAIETNKEIASRARQVMQAADKFAKKPSTIRKSIEAYEKAVGKNYGEVKNLIGEALPSYKSDLDMTSFSDTLKDINTRVIDPSVKDKLTNLTESLASQKTETIGDLIDTRQLFNKFYGKNSGHFENATDKRALMSIQDAIDTKIDEALNTLPDNVGGKLKDAFTDAKNKYSDMFKTKDTASYNAIFKKGASEDDIGRSLVKFSKAADGDMEQVLSKLSPVQRTKAEFSVLKQMLNMASSKGEAKAIDFGQLLDDIGTSRKVFKTPQAKQFLKNIETFNKKFAKDADIQSVAMGVTPRIKKNIATDVGGKAKMEIATKYFEAFQRLFPTETGRRLSLQKSIESALENSRSAKEFFFKASKIKGMPNKDREALKKSVKEIAKQDEILKKEAVRQKAKEDEKIAKEKLKQQQAVKKNEAKAKTRWENEVAKKRKTVQAEKAKDAAVPTIGGSEDDAKQQVKNLFAKNKSKEAKYKKMTQADIDELEKMDKEELLRSKPKGMSDQDWLEANTMFAKGGPELLVGTIAGVEQDENGNITLDPAKFVAGALGVTSIKGLAKKYKNSPKTQAKVEKALKELAKDSTRVAGDMIEKINKQIGLDLELKIIENGKGITKKPLEQFLDNYKGQSKIFTDDVFLNKREFPQEAMIKSDKAKDEDYIIRSINIKDIVPTQLKLGVDNLKNTINVDDAKNPIQLVGKNGKYYIKDGHHRVANKIINGDKNIEASVLLEN